MILLLLLLGMATGLALGLTGGGGSILAIPLLLFAAGTSMAQAVATSALAVGLSSLVGAVRGIRTGLVDPRSALAFAVTGMAGAPLGVRIGALLSDATRVRLFALLLLIVGTLMWRKAQAADAKIVRATILSAAATDLQGPACRYSEEGKLRMTTRCALALLAGGLGTGILSGTFGVGGGFLIVPALRALTGLTMHRALATSLAIITLISGSTVLSLWLDARTSFDVQLTWLFAGGTVAGLLSGALVAARLAGAALQRTFAALVLASSVLLLVRNYLI